MPIYLITYRKNNGEIFVRLTKSMLIALKGIGYKTGMGWTVIDIHVPYTDGNYYKIGEYKKMLRKKESLKKRVIRRIVRYLNKLA